MNMNNCHESTEPEYNPRSPDRQMAYRTKSIRLWGDQVDKELAELENAISEILKENPSLT